LAVIVAIISPLLAGVLFTRGGKYVLVLLLLFCIASEAESRRRLRRLVAERPREDIGTFARAFDRRGESFSPHVVRAVWDALEPYVSLKGSRVPLRPTDRIDRDLHIDWDDIEMILSEVAERTGRSTDGIEANPWYGRLSTVGDMVRLLSAQPPRQAA
jgi:hypothetical protein